MCPVIVPFFSLARALINGVAFKICMRNKDVQQQLTRTSLNFWHSALCVASMTRTKIFNASGSAEIN